MIVKLFSPNGRGFEDDAYTKYKGNDVKKIDPRYKNGLLKIKPKQTDEEIAGDYECGLSV